MPLIKRLDILPSSSVKSTILDPLSQPFHPSLLQTYAAPPDSGTFKDSDNTITPLKGGKAGLWTQSYNSLQSHDLGRAASAVGGQDLGKLISENIHM